jgi:hypothetical protein
MRIMVATLAALAFLTGCQHQQVRPAPAASAAVMKPVNSKCPVMDDEVDPKVTVQFKGQPVAFCCPECIEEWNSWSEEKRTRKLAGAK